MLTFRSLAEAQKARLPPHLLSHVIAQMQAIVAAHGRYDPDADGYLVLVTPETTDAEMVAVLGWKWQTSMFEGASYDRAARCFLVVILRDNQCAISILIPDESGLDPLIRARVMHELWTG